MYYNRVHYEGPRNVYVVHIQTASLNINLHIVNFIAQYAIATHCMVVLQFYWSVSA